VRVIGLMSGTSFDAIDAAAADLTATSDELELRPLGAVSAPLAADLRAEIAAAMPPSPTTMEAVCRLDTSIGQAFAAAGARAVEELCDGGADLIVSHGQTLFHWVDEAGQVRGSLQLSQPAWIAERTGLPVVSDLRARDIAAGGQGAPLVSLVDVLLLAGHDGVPAALNLGGIANLTVLPRGAEPLAYDVGPASALLDAAARHFTGEDRDTDGRLAAAGRVLPELLERLLADPYYAREPPKTTGKERFHLPYLLDALASSPATPADVLATLTRLTARAAADACRRHGVTRLFVSGGGTRNPALMAALAEEIAPVAIDPSDALGLPVDAKEAYAFAVLGFLTVHGVSATLPGCTGARHPALLGAITPGAAPLALPEPVAVQPRTLRVL
jgi:anhydro-N-acetylmuramic acid kinase